MGECVKTTPRTAMGNGGINLRIDLDVKRGSKLVNSAAPVQFPTIKSARFAPRLVDLGQRGAFRELGESLERAAGASESIFPVSLQ